MERSLYGGPVEVPFPIPPIQTGSPCRRSMARKIGCNSRANKRNGSMDSHPPLPPANPSARPLPGTWSKRLSTLFLSLALALVPAWPASTAQKRRPIVLVTGPETADLLNSLMKPLLRAAGYSDKTVKLHVMLAESLNAFALPNQHIVLHSGLLLKVRGRDELAGVLAHELAHLAAGHHVKLRSDAKGMSVSTLIAALAGLAVGAATGSGRMGQATMMGGMASARSSMLSSVRQKELQADRLALRYLSDAGFDPNGLAGFLERVSQEQRLTQLPPPYLMTHPISSQRVMEARQMARDRPTRSLRPDDRHDFALKRVQAKLVAGTTRDPATAATRFRNRLKKHPKDFPARYGLAAAQRYTGHLPEAEKNLNRLLKTHPGDIYLLRERGLVRLERGNMKRAEADLRQALAKKPNNDDLQYWLAFVLKERKKHAEAARLLRRLTLKHPLKARYFYLLGLVEGKQGRRASSHLALGHHYRLKLERRTARWHYEEASKLFPKNSQGWRLAKNELKKLQQKH